MGGPRSEGNWAPGPRRLAPAPGPPSRQAARGLLLPPSRPPAASLPGSGPAGAGGSAMAAARRLMALAAGVSPRLRLPGHRATGRQGRSRGLSSGCVHPDHTKEAAEAEAGVAPSDPGEGDGSMVNGEGRAATPLAPGAVRAGSTGRGRAWRAGAPLR